MARSMVGHPQVQLATTRTCETCGAYCCASEPPCAISHCNSVRSASVSGLSSGRVPINGSDLLLSTIAQSIGQNPDKRGSRTSGVLELDLSGASSGSQVDDFACVRFFRRVAGRELLPRAEFTSLFGEGL